MQQLAIISLLIFISFSVALAFDVFKLRNELKKHKFTQIAAIVVLVAFILFMISFYRLISGFTMYY